MKLRRGRKINQKGIEYIGKCGGALKLRRGQKINQKGIGGIGRCGVALKGRLQLILPDRHCLPEPTPQQGQTSGANAAQVGQTSHCIAIQAATLVRTGIVNLSKVRMHFISQSVAAAYCILYIIYVTIYYAQDANAQRWEMCERTTLDHLGKADHMDHMGNMDPRTFICTMRTIGAVRTIEATWTIWTIGP